MPRKFSESNALAIATEHLKKLALPWERAKTRFIQKRWWGLFGPDAFFFEFVGEAGWADVWVEHSDTVRFCAFYPVDGRFLMVPLWIQFPEYNSMTIHWRMGPGEVYRNHWSWWFRRLTHEERLNYQKQYPAATDEERGWSEFYNWLEI
jgi:hypothetical protein